MTILTELKSCQECGDPLKGRTDKKFCSDQCRAAFNNRLNSDETNFVRNVNNLIRKNRRILTRLNASGKTKVSRSTLAEKGFDFMYFTSTHTTKDGAICYYCYEQGYLPVEKEQFLLVTREDNNT
jgi:hypothetical protein